MIRVIFHLLVLLAYVAFFLSDVSCSITSFINTSPNAKMFVGLVTFITFISSCIDLIKTIVESRSLLIPIALMTAALGAAVVTIFLGVTAQLQDKEHSRARSNEIQLREVMKQ